MISILISLRGAMPLPDSEVTCLVHLGGLAVVGEERAGDAWPCWVPTRARKHQPEWPAIKHLNVIAALLDKTDEVITEYEKLSIRGKPLPRRAVRSCRERSRFGVLSNSVCVGGGGPLRAHGPGPKSYSVSE